MRNFVIRVIINAVAVWVAAQFVPGIRISGGLVGLAIIGLVFGIVNAIIKPVVKFFTFPFILLTLGLFTLVINAAMLGLTAALTKSLAVSGVWPAIVGSIVISLVSFCLSAFLDDEKK